MPTYDYECDNGHNFEHLQPITSDPLEECLQCGAPVRRLIGGGTGIIFKGSGFYVNDSKAKSGAAAKTKDGDKTKPDNAATDKTTKSGGDGSAGGDGAASGDSSSDSSTKTNDKTTKKAAST